MNIENNMLTASFRIFGYGTEAEPIITSLSGLSAEGIEVAMMKENNFPVPEENDKMAIFLMTDLSNDGINFVCNAAYAFLQADVLSLILTPELEFDPACCDAYSEVPISKMLSTVMALINPLIHHGIINFDFSDLRNLLRNSEIFQVETSEGSGNERVRQAMNNLSCEFNDGSECQRLGILVSCNQNVSPALETGEFSALPAFIETLNPETEVIWCVYYDNSIPSDSVRITYIAVGRRWNHE